MIEPMGLYRGSFVSPLVVLFLIFFIGGCFFMMNKDKSFSLTKMYFTLVSFVGIIGMVVAFGIVLYNIIISNVITDDEYLAGRGYREVEQCSDPYYKSVPLPLAEGEAPEAKTAEEIEECERNARERVLSQRSVNKKETIVGGLVRGIIFWVLYFTHYPTMKGEEHTKQEKPTPKKRTPSKTPAKKKATAKTKKTTTKKKTTKK